MGATGEKPLLISVELAHCAVAGQKMDKRAYPQRSRRGAFFCSTGTTSERGCNYGHRSLTGTLLRTGGAQLPPTVILGTENCTRVPDLRFVTHVEKMADAMAVERGEQARCSPT